MKNTKQTQECLERAKKEIATLVQLFPTIKRHCECRGAIECAQWAIFTLVVMCTGIYKIMGPVVVFALYPIASPFWQIRRLPFAIKELDDTIDKWDLRSKYLSALKDELDDFPAAD